jgi:hypothetical protein
MVSAYAEVLLTRGQVALVDVADLPLVSSYTWQAKPNKRGTWYADTRITTRGTDHRRILMHRLLMPGVPQIDHKNGNGLDNRRSTGNLRPATTSQNAANKPKVRGNARYKGVRWRASSGRWSAQIKYHGHQTHLGYFASEAEAARAYNAAALERFGDFARLNEVQP